MVESGFSTPSRPISREQFTSLRQRVAKDSPKLYKNKVLSGPDENANVHASRRKGDLHDFKKASITATSNSMSNSGSNSISRLPTALSPSVAGEIGFFENPVLHTLAQRTVNKEWETQRLIVNIIAWAIWDLLTKFFNTLAKHSKIGKQLVLWINKELIQNQNHSNNISNNRENNFFGFFKSLSHKYPFFREKLNWSNLNFFFHLIVIINILISLWRLLSKVKTDDLHLNENQRQLLGIVDQKSNMNGQKNGYLHHPEQSVKEFRPISSRDSNTTPQEPPSTPFLFKSLETPMKSKQRKEFVTENDRSVTQSAFVNKLNVFGLPSSFGNGVNYNAKSGSKPGLEKLFSSSVTATPASKTGYIPSSKYTYMMNSPTPRKNT